MTPTSGHMIQGILDNCERKGMAKMMEPRND